MGSGSTLSRRAGGFCLAGALVVTMFSTGPAAMAAVPGSAPTAGGAAPLRVATVTPASTQGLAPLRAWSATTASVLASQPNAGSVHRRLVALKPAVVRAARNLKAMKPAAQRQQLRRTQKALQRDLLPLATRLPETARYTFYLGYQAQLEALATKADLATTPTGLSRRNGAAPDTDLDGLVDVADKTPGSWGVPEGFAVRPQVAVAASLYRTGYCVWGTEGVPDVTKVSDALAWRDEAADRGCAPPGSSISSATLSRARFVALRKSGLKATAAEVEGTTLRVRVSAKKTAKLKLDVVSGKKVVAKAKKVKVKGAKKPKARQITATLDRAPSGSLLRLRITAKVGKKKARGLIPLRIVEVKGVVVPPPAPPGSTCTPGADTDGDTIPDCQELEGFEFSFYRPAAQCTGLADAFDCVVITQKRVTSDPNKANTDDDALVRDGVTYQLTDADEWTLYLVGGRADPSARDSDSDGLSDVEEVFRWGTDPKNPDSDGDSGSPDSAGAAPDTDLFDKAEVDGGTVPGSSASTSPTSEDTDGDGYDDLLEVNDGTLNPVVADTPYVSVVPDPGTSLTIDFGQTIGQLSSVALTNEDTTQKTSESENVVEKITEVKDEIKVGAEIGFEGATPAGKISADYTHSWGTTDRNTATTKFTDQSVNATGSAFANNYEVSTPATGTVEGTFEVKNRSEKEGLAELSNLSVIGRVPCLPVASDPVSCTPGTSFDIGPFTLKDPTPQLIDSQQTIALVLQAKDVPGARLRSLAANPRNIQFRVTNAQLKRPGSSETVAEEAAGVKRSTAMITIDQGNGEVDRYAVAAAIGRAWGRPAAAQSLPIALTDALDAIGVAYETAPGMDNTTVLSSVAGLAAVKPPAGGRTLPGGWFVLTNDKATTPTPQFEGVSDPDIRNLKVGIFSDTTLAYRSDADGDSFLDTEEDQMRTSDTSADSDGDGATANCIYPTDVGCLPNGKYASDYFESQVGWNTGQVKDDQDTVVKDPYAVRSNPAKADGDGDGSNDAVEQAEGTDPTNRDTDGDQPLLLSGDRPWAMDDGPDPQPLIVASPKGPTNGFWSAADMGNPVLDVQNESTVVSIADVCGPPQVPAVQNDPCATATGYYRFTWKFAGNNFQRRGQNAAIFRITAERPGGGGEEVLMDAILPRHKLRALSTPEDKTMKLYVKTRANLKNVKISFTRTASARPTSGPCAPDCLTPLTVQSLRMEPVSQAVFEDPVFQGGTTPGTADPDFLAIAIPGRDILSSTPDANSNQSAPIVTDQTAWASNGNAAGNTLARKFRAFKPPVSSINPYGTGETAQRVMARFGIDGTPTANGGTCGSATCGVVSVGLVGGSGTPQIAFSRYGYGNANANGTINAYADEGGMFVSSATSQPRAQGKLYPPDMGGEGKYFNLVASSTNLNEPLKPSIAASSDAGNNLRLTNVVLQEMDPRSYVGTVATQSGSKSGSDGPWAGVGFSPREFTKTSTDTANEGSDVILRNGPGSPNDSGFTEQDADPRPASSITNLGNGDGATFYDEIGIPTNAGTDYRDRPRWAISLIKTQGGNCSNTATNNVLTSMVSPVLPSLVSGNFWPYRNGLPGTAVDTATSNTSKAALFTPNSHAGATFTSMQLSLAGGNQCTNVPNVRILQTMLLHRGAG